MCSEKAKGTNGVSNNGVTANSMFFDRVLFLGAPVNLLLFPRKVLGSTFVPPICQKPLLVVTFVLFIINNINGCPYMYTSRYMYMYAIYIHIYIYIYTYTMLVLYFFQNCLSATTAASTRQGRAARRMTTKSRRCRAS